ncbi:UNVERIFIED_CONTAM: hypothetical protein Scaly_2230300 [Sesamum calycinum]|uniref:Uncharacterized protein n=1 Tax=Sesamum calycinum TaxID=2727403 RepID=A0AAW2M909_9LAMI
MAKLWINLNLVQFWRWLRSSPADHYESFSVELPRVGGALEVKNLESLIRVHRPSLVFLSETKCSSYRISCLHSRLNMHGVGVDSHGRSGGLALFWDKSVSCVLRSFSRHHIDVTVQAYDDSSPWHFTDFYGEPNTSK